MPPGSPAVPRRCLEGWRRCRTSLTFGSDPAPDASLEAVFGNGDGAVNAGGALVPVLVGGYMPPANKEFPILQLLGGKFARTFSRVRGGSSADYKHEATTPAFGGIIYGKATT